jgi:hypothetical protein
MARNRYSAYSVANRGTILLGNSRGGENKASQTRRPLPIYGSVICMYVYVCVCMYVCVHIYIYVCEFICVKVCTYIFVCIHMYVCIWVFPCFLLFIDIE